jgi:chorismate synthase
MIRFLTAGESHGKGLTVIIEGIPAGVRLDEEYIARDLARRQVGYGRGGRMKIETDRAEILSGVRHGYTMGGPISLWIVNRDFSTGKGPDGKPWTDVMSTSPTEATYETIQHLRPGHADTPGVTKYMHEDARNILERSSARESAARVAAGAIAKRFLEEFDIAIHGHVTNIGGVYASPVYPINWEDLETTPYSPENPQGSKISAVRCTDQEAAERMIIAIDSARADGDSLGGIIEIIASGVPIGIGDYVQWDRKLTSKIAAATMSINAVKGVELGIGFQQADMRGSEVHDVIKPVSDWSPSDTKGWEQPFPRKTNNSGGFEGGMSTGEPIIVRAVVKPIATIIEGLPTVSLVTGEFVAKAHFERSDITFVPTCSIIGESMIALTIADCMLEKFGGDNIKETHRNYINYMKSILPI